jgi:hypothetical protein
LLWTIKAKTFSRNGWVRHALPIVYMVWLESF